MPTIYEVRNVPLGIRYALTINRDRARVTFESEAADPMNSRHLVTLEANGVLIDHAGGGWERGALCRHVS